MVSVPLSAPMDAGVVVMVKLWVLPGAMVEEARDPRTKEPPGRVIDPMVRSSAPVLSTLTV